jgi:hypothetical protein
LLPLTVAYGASPPLRTDNLDSRLVAAPTAVVPGQQLRVGLWLRHDPDWHTYWLNPGDSGLATRIELELPPGFEAGPIRWPVPERLPAGPLVNFGYSETVVLPLDITVPAVIDAASVTLRARADWLICKVECIPGDGEYTLILPVAGAAEPDARWAADWSAENIKTKGGLDPISSILEFAIGPDNDNTIKLVNEAGLLVAYCVDGKNVEVTKQWHAVFEALRAQGDVETALKALRKTLLQSEAEIRAFAKL